MAIPSIKVTGIHEFTIVHDTSCVRLVMDDLGMDISYPMWTSILSASSELCRTNYLEPEIACDK